MLSLCTWWLRSQPMPLPCQFLEMSGTLQFLQYARASRLRASVRPIPPSRNPQGQLAGTNHSIVSWSPGRAPVCPSLWLLKESSGLSVLFSTGSIWAPSCSQPINGKPCCLNNIKFCGCPSFMPRVCSSPPAQVTRPGASCRHCPIELSVMMEVFCICINMAAISQM